MERAAAALTAASFMPSENPTAAIPNSDSVRASSVSVPPYSGWLCRIASPGRTEVSRVVAIAAMPELNSSAASAPS
jgi:hypothetical protein